MRKKSADYLEMLFENRNKAYGAYDLRVNYENRLCKSFGMALLIAGLFFLIPFLLTKILTQMQEKEKAKPTFVYDLSQKFVIEKEKTESRPLVSRSKVVSDNSYKIVNKEELKNEEKITNPDINRNPVLVGDSSASSDNTGTNNQFNTKTDSAFSEPFNLAAVDEPPSFPGGEEAMMKFLKKNIHYPASARGENITGRVYISFIIDENGKVTNVEIMRGLGYGLEEEVVRVAGIMPDWRPGKYHGMNVKTALIMPVFFSLE